MKLKKLLLELVDTEQQLIKEIGDLSNIDVFDYKIVNPELGLFSPREHQDYIRVEAEVVDMSRHPVEFPEIVEHEKRRVINIGYTVNDQEGQSHKADFKYLIQVIKTVVEISFKLIEQNNKIHKVNGLYPVYVFMPFDKLGVAGSDPQKYKFYELLMRKHCPPNYRMGKAKLSAIYNGFFAYKI